MALDVRKQKLIRLCNGIQSAPLLEGMKTTIDIPEKELKDAMRFTKAKTKREAVNTAIAEFNRRQRAAAIVKTFGTWEMASNDEIEAEQLAAEAERRHGAHR